MIFYFSGTGNSKFVAERLSRILNDEIFSINDTLKGNITPAVCDGARLVFVAPTYSWRLPKVIEKWILDTDFGKEIKAYFVLTCGGEIGNSAKFIRKLCKKKKFEYMGTAEIVMPENYIAMFDVPSEKEAEDIVLAAVGAVEKLGVLIASGEKILDKKVCVLDRMKSSFIVNGGFYAFCVKAKKFEVKEKCVSCGKCVSVCPLNNIKMENGRPTWGKNCTHCMACICFCPTEAIEYGKTSVGKRRYRLPTINVD